jgi:hypothetical protein
LDYTEISIAHGVDSQNVYIALFNKNIVFSPDLGEIIEVLQAKRTIIGPNQYNFIYNQLVLANKFLIKGKNKPARQILKGLSNYLNLMRAFSRGPAREVYKEIGSAVKAAISQL